MAYLLGFTFADGYVTLNKNFGLYLGFVSTDLQIIEEIRKVLSSDHKIGKRVSMKREWKDQYRLQIGSRILCKSLESYGIFQNKSLTMRLRKDIPEIFLGDFLRGYFDGDGCIYFKKHIAKDRCSPRWVFQCKFISGSRAFLEDIHLVLSKHVLGGFIVKKTAGFELCFSHNDSRILYALMYKNLKNNLFLARKYEKFTHAMNTLQARNALRNNK